MKMHNFTNKFNAEKKLSKLDRKNAYITFKDHKQPKLNNPTKTKLGYI